MNISSQITPRFSPGATCDFGASKKVADAKADPSKGCTFGPRDTVQSASQEDLGLIDPSQLKKSSRSENIGLMAGLGALAGGIAPGILIPFVGFALAPVGVIAGGLAGAAIGACLPE